MDSNILQNIIFSIGAGVFCLILAEIMKIPSIVLLLMVGILMGPEYLHLISPLEVQPALPTFIEIGVAIILFEGGLSLKLSQFKSISGPVKNLLSVGALVSFFGGSFGAHWIIGVPWRYSFIFGALMIVTGPTVMAPILKRLPLRKSVSSILNWESILLDPIGIIMAVLIAEFVLIEEISLPITIFVFLKTILVGSAIGLAFGWVLKKAVKHLTLLSQENLNLMILAGALLSFECSEIISSESGILAVVISGMVLGNSRSVQKSQITEFKETLSSLFISFLFIFLASRLNITEVFHFANKGWFFLGFMIFLVRPLGVFLSTDKTTLTLREKLFICWTAPRGIVAASTASLFALRFIENGEPEAVQLENLTYFMIVMTILLQGMTAGVTARLLGLLEKRSGYLIIGAHSLGRTIAHWLQNKSIEVKLVDSNSRDIEIAVSEGLEAYKGSALNASFLQEIHIQKLGHLLALSSSHNLNILVSQLGDDLFGKNKSYQIFSERKKEAQDKDAPIGGASLLPNFPHISIAISGLDEKSIEFKEVKLTQDWTYTAPILTDEGAFWPLLKLTKNSSISIVAANQQLKNGETFAGFILHNKQHQNLSEPILVS